MPEKWFNVFVGSETGLLKGIQAEEATWKNFSDAKRCSRKLQINDIAWYDRNESQILLGRKNNAVEVWSADTSECLLSHNFPDDAGCLRSIAYTDVGFITATDLGCIRLWDEDYNEETRIDAGPNLWRMRQNPSQRSQLATGGRDTPLRLWDLNRPDEATFVAKNVKHNWLNLRVPVWVTDMQFVEGTSQIATCTGHRHVRLYDTTCSQRRPVIQIEHGENPFTCLAVRPDKRQVVVGDTNGSLALFDLRRKSLVQAYKGTAGSVRAACIHPSLPLLVTAGLDRFVRVHQLDSRQLLHKVYVKSALNCLLLRSTWLQSKPEDAQTEEEEAVEACEPAAPVEEEEEDDDLWQQMELVGAKRRQTDSAEPTVKKKRKRSKSGKR